MSATMKYVDLWVHGDKDSASDAGEELGLEGEALSMFRHITTEFKMTFLVDMETGVGTLVAVNDRILSIWKYSNPEAPK